MNYCTADKDGWAVLKYACGEENIKLHEYTARCCREHGCKNITADFVAEDGLFDCCDCPVAIMYYCGSQAAENNAQFSAYEDTGLTPKEIRKMQSENAKLRELLKLALQDIPIAASDFCEYCTVCKCRKDNTCEYRMNHSECINASGFRWQHADEVEEVLKDENT